MSGSVQEAKTRQLAFSVGPGAKKECRACPFAKEYDLVERQIALVDRQGRVHVLKGYVREGGNWLDGMVSILKQNGAAAEKIFLPGCGWGISTVVLKDGTVIENPHGYFDRKLPVAVIGGERTELNFANIRIQDQEVVLKDEAPNCPFGKSTVDTNGLVFGKGEYGELDPASGMISWGMVGPAGAQMFPLGEMAPGFSLPVAEAGIPPAQMQGLLAGARGFDAVSFMRMEGKDWVTACAVEFAARQAISSCHQEREMPAAPPEARTEHPGPALEFAAAPAKAYAAPPNEHGLGPAEKMENARIAMPEKRRETAMCAAWRPEGAGIWSHVEEEPLQVKKAAFSAEETREQKRAGRKMQIKSGSGAKMVEQNMEPQKGGKAEKPGLTAHAMGAAVPPVPAAKVFPVPENAWAPAIPQRRLEKVAVRIVRHREQRLEKAPKAPRRAGAGNDFRARRDGRIESRTAGAKPRGTERRAAGLRPKACKRVGPEAGNDFRARRDGRIESRTAGAKPRGTERRAAGLRPKARERKGRGMEAPCKNIKGAGKRKKRGDYAEKYLLMKRPVRRKRRDWLAISRR